MEVCKNHRELHIGRGVVYQQQSTLPFYMARVPIRERNRRGIRELAAEHPQNFDQLELINLPCSTSLHTTVVVTSKKSILTKSKRKTWTSVRRLQPALLEPAPVTVPHGYRKYETLQNHYRRNRRWTDSFQLLQLNILPLQPLTPPSQPTKATVASACHNFQISGISL